MVQSSPPSDATSSVEDGSTTIERELLVVARNQPFDADGTLAESGWDVRRVESVGEMKQACEAGRRSVLLISDRVARELSANSTEPSHPSRSSPPSALAGFEGVLLLGVEEYTPANLTLALECGCATLFRWDDDPGDLQRILRQEARRRLRSQNQTGDYAVEVPPVVGRSSQMDRLSSRIVGAAPSDANMLVTGESGTGKELVARAVHRFSPRRDAPFVAINCGAIPPDLVESELFGHKKGAFTNATSDRKGRFELADGGTLFLDEVAELPDALQVKLLRVLQNGTVEPVGASEPIEVDTRVIGATNQAVSPHGGESPLRDDLFFRLNVLQMEVPPLRERPSDIEPMWHHFVREAARAEARHGLRVDDAVLERLEQHTWPGNVRELQNVARHSTVVARDGVIDVESLPGYLRKSAEFDDSRLPLAGRSLEALERTAILQTCESVSTVKQAAELLGVSERTVYYRKKQYRTCEDDAESPS